VRWFICGVPLLLACTGTIEPISQTPGAVAGGGAAQHLLPVYARAGIRRLSQSEVQTAAALLLGISAQGLAAALGSDTRQENFTRNADQRVGSVAAEDLWQALQSLAHEAVTQRLEALAPCPATPTGSDACAQEFIHRFAVQAFRRSVSASEEASLFAVFQAGKLDGTYALGIELVINAVLQSGSFLYVTELGAAPSALTVNLTGEEIATNLALLFTGAPADELLLSQGRSGRLNTATARAAAARALLKSPGGPAQVSRLLLEWLGIDTVDSAPKDTTLFPQWSALRADVLSESRSMVSAVVDSGDGTFKSLLLTPQTTVSAPLATFYALPSSGFVMQPSYRRGLLLTSGFLASHSRPDSTTPVKRGAIIRKKLLCQELVFPSSSSVVIVVPPPDPTQTTRERFAVHSANPTCWSCHRLLDPIGFALENFDATGRYRRLENNKTIDASGMLSGAGDADGAFDDAAGLVARLADSTAVRECFQRQVFRFGSGVSGPDEERTFLDFLKQRPAASTQKIVDLLIAYVESDSFILRRP
jgi:hypothetical protein